MDQDTTAQVATTGIAVASDVAEIIASPAARIAASEDLISQVIGFLHWAFPGHPQLPAIPAVAAKPAE